MEYWYFLPEVKANFFQWFRQAGQAVHEFPISNFPDSLYSSGQADFRLWFGIILSILSNRRLKPNSKFLVPCSLFDIQFPCHAKTDSIFKS
jgi:hypothetical protein